MGAQALRNAYHRTVAQNSVVVTIKRTKETQSEGEWTTDTVTIGPFRAGIQRRPEVQAAVVVAAGGVVTRSREWILLVEATDQAPLAELEEYAETPSQVTDVFFLDGYGNFRLVDARVDRFKNEVCGYTLLLVQEG